MRAITERIERSRKSPRRSPVIIDDEPCRFHGRRYCLWASKYPQWQRRPALPDRESGSPATPTVYQGPEDPFRFGHHRRATGWWGNRVQVLCDALLPRLKTWMEDFLDKELHQVVQVFLDRTVPRLVAEHADTALQALLDEKIVSSYATRRWQRSPRRRTNFQRHWL